MESQVSFTMGQLIALLGGGGVLVSGAFYVGTLSNRVKNVEADVKVIYHKLDEIFKFVRNGHGGE